MKQAHRLTFGCGTASLEAAGGRACGSREAAASLASHRTISDRVRVLAGLHSKRLALFDAEVALTYGELDRAVDSAAWAVIQASGPDPEAVMLVTGVNAAAVIAALGVMRAGKHFVAIEAALPTAQIARIAQHVSARLVLAGPGQVAIASAALGAGCRVLEVNDLRRCATRVELPVARPDPIALLNCTSGSTGTPKVVVHTHASALSQATRYADAFLLGNADRLASFGSLAWAGSCWDVFGPLCVGATAGLYDVRRHGLHLLPDWIERNRATVLSGMVTMRTLCREFSDRRLEHVRLIQLGGDTVYRVDAQACQRVFPAAYLAAGFGTTETGRATQHFIAPGVTPTEEVVPIGFPLPGMSAWTVDETGAETEPGTVGEIVIRADDLAAGYHGLPALTAEKFRREPPSRGKPLYFTGDLGRKLPNGALQHLGRKDFQIKVRGYQVPANEVEALLLASPGVREACVVVQGPPAGPESLVGFVVRDPACGLSADALLTQLRGVLPDFMVPRRLIDLPALPRTPTGKADRKALQEIRLPRLPPLPTGGASRMAPCSPAETRIAAIWREVLGIGEIGVDDDFLSIGGDSLQAMQIAGRVLRAFGLEMSPSHLLSRSTIAEMAALVEENAASDATPALIPRLERRT